MSKIVCIPYLEPYQLDMIRDAAPGWETIHGEEEMLAAHLQDSKIVVGWNELTERLCMQVLAMMMSFTRKLHLHIRNQKQKKWEWLGGMGEMHGRVGVDLTELDNKRIPTDRWGFFCEHRNNRDITATLAHEQGNGLAGISNKP